MRPPLFALSLLFLSLISLFLASPVALAQVKIAQIYPRGGNGSVSNPATYNSDYVVLVNASHAGVDLTGWSLQYATASATTWSTSNKIALTGLFLRPGQFYLIKMSSGAFGAALPTPDVSSSVSMISSGGKVALVNDNNALSCGSNCIDNTTNTPNDPNLVDFVAYGGSANDHEGTGDAPAMTDQQAVFRQIIIGTGGAFDTVTDTDDNAADFTVGTPDPKNSSSDRLTLPVELTSFEGRLDGRDVVLRWETASETNNAGFEVEHRTGETGGEAGGGTADVLWHRLGFVAGHGTTTEARHYDYRAAGLAPGPHVFRLRQVDYDGAFEYSREVEVSLGVPGTHVLSEVYPNPFNPTTSFTLAVSTRQHVRAAVFDALGRQVALLHDGPVEAGQVRRFAFDGAGLPSGTYRLRIDGETFRASRGLVLSK